MYCAAVNCSSKSDSTISSFFRYPKDTYQLVALIKYLYRMLYRCQVTGVQPRLLPVRGYLRGCHLPACVLRIPVPLPFPVTAKGTEPQGQTTWNWQAALWDIPVVNPVMPLPCVTRSAPGKNCEKTYVLLSSFANDPDMLIINKLLLIIFIYLYLMTFHNFLPGALRVTQVHKIIYRHVPQGRL